VDGQTGRQAGRQSTSQGPGTCRLDVCLPLRPLASRLHSTTHMPRPTISSGAAGAHVVSEPAAMGSCWVENWTDRIPEEDIHSCKGQHDRREVLGMAQKRTTTEGKGLLRR
jgi:hypothetical protein